MQAHYGHGATLFHIGALDAARAHLEAALRDYDPATHRQHILVYGGYDPGVACSLWLAWTLALQGELDEAAARDREGLALAHRHGELFSLAWAYYGVGVSQQLFGDWAASESRVRRGGAAGRGARLPVRARHGDGQPRLGAHDAGQDGQPASRCCATAWRWSTGRVRRSSGRRISACSPPPTSWKATGSRPSPASTRHSAKIERTGERLHEAALLIGKSHLLAAGGDRGRSSRAGANAAEDCLRRALDVARAQGARLVELRAAVALARHCRERGRTDEARALLSAAYAWFADRPPAAPEIVAARRLLTTLDA